MSAACLKSFGDLNTPGCGHAPAWLSPLQPSGLVCTQFGGYSVDQRPSEGVVGHDSIIGRFVQTVKDHLPKDSRGTAWHNSSMPKDTTSTEYRAQFLERVKALRVGMKHADGKPWTAEDMAVALGVEADTYRKYESRSLLPHELIKRFALITGVTVEFLMTGNKPVDIRTMRYRKRAVDSSKREEKRA